MSKHERVTEMQRVIAGLPSMYESMASRMGSVCRCHKCGRKRQVDPAKCLRSGWPECCGSTMAVDSAEAKR